MKSRTHRRFWNEFNRLPAHVQCLARDKFQLWVRDLFHPSLQFKPLGHNVWSVRIGDHYRALARGDGDLVVWFWIGTHEEYNSFIKQSRSLADGPALRPYHFNHRQDQKIFLRSCFETQSLPSLLRCYPCSFTFYLGNPFSSIPN